MMSIKKYWVMFCVFIGGIAIGLCMAGLTTERVVLVDINSGRIKQKIRVGGVVLRKDGYPPTGFEILPVEPSVYPHGSDWRVAHKFVGWSHVSASRVGGIVLSTMTDIATSSFYPSVGIEEAASAKSQLLEAMKKESPLEAAQKAKMYLRGINKTTEKPEE